MREDTIVSINDMVDNAYHVYESANQKTRATITEANQMVDNVNVQLKISTKSSGTQKMQAG